MRLLVITKYEWDDGLAGGNTLSNFMGDWSDVEIYNIYCRDAMPRNTCCQNYFSVSPIDLAKNLFTPWRIGRQFSYKGFSDYPSQENLKQETSLKRVSKKNQRLFGIAYDFLYSTMIWMNRKLKSFIRIANPDLVFVFGTPDVFNYQVTKYIKRVLNVPIVAYFVDDHYNKKAAKCDIIHMLGKRRIKKTAEMATKCYAISRPMCEEYSFEFNKAFSLLFKGCELTEVKTRVCSPIKIVYAGNLYYGRDMVLCDLAKSISIINKESIKVHLDIYTSTEISGELSTIVKNNASTTIFPPRPYKEIKRILHDSDIVLHVESFNEEQVNAVRLSFSTKITDCIQSGAKVLAIGPNSIASICFLQSIPGVTVITNRRQIMSTIQELVQTTDSILADAHATDCYARAFLSKDLLTKQFKSDLYSLVH